MAFGETQVLLVDPGTVEDAEGNDMVVTDRAAVVKGDRMWVTKKIFDAMIERAKRGPLR